MSSDVKCSLCVCKTGPAQGRQLDTREKGTIDRRLMASDAKQSLIISYLFNCPSLTRKKAASKCSACLCKTGPAQRRGADTREKGAVGRLLMLAVGKKGSP